MKHAKLKDEKLNELASKYNIAQFISFAPGMEPSQRFARVFGYTPNYSFCSLRKAIEALLSSAPEKSINVRSFREDQLQGNEFLYGLTSPDDIESAVRRLAGSGHFTILNETIDVNDGGVSGVLQDNHVEFSPGDIPRFVEKASDTPIPTFPRGKAISFLKMIYGVAPDIEGFSDISRVEFSLHPKRRGWLDQHTIIWEVDEKSPQGLTPFILWPNSYSKFIGDKAYGLMVAANLGFYVPRTTVFPRNEKLGLFTFGRPTGSEKKWVRTCPTIQEPGKYTTTSRWVNPYSVMQQDDPTGENVASCLVQEEVPAKYSGAFLVTKDKELKIEGVEGYGCEFMQGTQAPMLLPQKIEQDVRASYLEMCQQLPVTRFEWVHDGHRVWIVQVHTEDPVSTAREIYPGFPEHYFRFEVSTGLENLRSLVKVASKHRAGIELVGNVGLSSHIADVLRKAKVPSKMVSE